MPNWNGMEVSVEAHRVALKIEAQTGFKTLPESFTVTPVQSLLRNFYVATGGNRSAAAIAAGRGYNPTNRELRRVYNGNISGAALMKAALKQGDTEEKPVVTDDETPEAQALAAIKALMGGQKVDPQAVRDIAKSAVDARIGEVLSSMAGLIADEVAKQVRTIEVKVAGLPKVKVEKAHKSFERVLRYAAQRKNVLLVGPAGSGKTTLAEQVSAALGLEFYFSGKCVDEVKITGYMDGSGTYHTTAFRQAYEKGGLFLFDEMDGWSPDALIAVNAPLAGQWGDFPDGMVRRHPDFVALAAANTFGRGADRQYVGREQLDAATLDRFAVIEVDYDEELEMAISCDPEWTKYVQSVRAAVASEKVRHVVSPRASIDGGVMIKAGEPQKLVEEAYIWKGMEEVVRNRVIAAMR